MAGPVGRRLIALSELDVARDICDFTFILRSDTEISDLKFYLELTEWTQDQMQILVNFTEPMIISKGFSKD